MIPNMPSAVPARHAADVLRKQAERRIAGDSSSRKANHTTITRPGGMRTAGDGSIDTEAADGTAARLAGGVVEVRPDPDSPWRPLEDQVLDQVPSPDPVAPLTSPELTWTGGAGNGVLTWDAVAQEGPVANSYDIHRVTDTNGVADRDGDTTYIGTSTGTDFPIIPANGPELYAAWARAGDQFAPEQSDPIEGAPDAAASSIIVADGFYGFDGFHAISEDGSGARVDMTGAGIDARGVGGVTKTFGVDSRTGIMSAVGAVISGLFTAAYLLVTSLVIRGIARLDPGTTMIVQSGIVTPSKPIIVDEVWPNLRTAWADDTIATPDLNRGLLANSPGAGEFLTAFIFYGGGGLRYVLADGTAGPPLGGFDFFANKLVPDGGITRIGNTYDVLCRGTGGGPRDGKWYVERLDTSFNRIGEWYVDFSTLPPRRPAIGTNGVDVLIGRVAPVAGVQRMLVNRWNPTTGQFIGDAVTEVFGTAADVTSVSVINSRYVVTTSRGTWNYLTSNGTRDTATERPAAGSAFIVGAAFDGTYLRHLDAEGRIWQYSTVTTATARVLEYDWFDANPTGGLHESDRGGTVNYTQRPGTWMRLETPPPPFTGETNSPNSVRIWIGGFRQPDLGVGVTSYVYGAPATGVTSKETGFDDAGLQAAKIESEKQDGDGGWRYWGNGRSDVRDPKSAIEAANKRYVDAGGLMATAALTKSGTQTVTGSQVLSSFTAEVQGAIVTNASAGTITIAETGWYDVAASIRYTGTGTGRRYLFIVVDGVDVISEYEVPVSSNDTWVSRARPLRLTAGQVVTLRAQQDSGTSTATAGIGTYFTVTKISA